MKRIFTIIITIFFLISQIGTLIYFYSLPAGYKGMVFLPFIYFIGYFIFYYDFIGNCSNPFVLYGVLVMEGIRFTLMPLFCSIAGSQNGMSYINPTVSSLNIAVIFMIIEYLGVSLFCKLMIKPEKRKKETTYILLGEKLIYYLFFIFAIGIYFVAGRGKGLIRFLIINVGSGERVGDITNSGLLIVRQVILCAIFLSFVLVVYKAWRLYKDLGKNSYFYIALLAAMINVSIIIGERRTAQIYALLCSLWILVSLFPKFKSKIILGLGLAAGIVLVFMSIYKFFGAFMFNSYSAAISNSQIDVPFISRTLQSYFFGPENIAISLDFFNSNSLGISQMFFDILRSVFGLNYVFKDFGDVTSVFFNTFVYGFNRNTGQVISAAAYGYGFLGTVFVPFFAILNIFISIKIENLLYRLKSLELIYVTVYVLTRFVTNLFVNTPPLISQGTMMAFTSLIVIGIAAMFNYRKRNRRVDSARW